MRGSQKDQPRCYEDAAWYRHHVGAFGPCGSGKAKGKGKSSAAANRYGDERGGKAAPGKSTLTQKLAKDPEPSEPACIEGGEQPLSVEESKEKGKPAIQKAVEGALGVMADAGKLSLKAAHGATVYAMLPETFILPVMTARSPCMSPLAIFT